jgi:hypothetical protein
MIEEPNAIKTLNTHNDRFNEIPKSLKKITFKENSFPMKDFSVNIEPAF